MGIRTHAAKIRGLYALCDQSMMPDRSLPWLAQQLVLGGADIVQLRVKDRAGAEPRRAQAAQTLRTLRKQHHFVFIVNDDPRLAQQTDADGVHVGADDMPLEQCRRLLGPSKIIGYSAHSLHEAYAAEQAGADYVAFGAIFRSPTKGPDHPVQGLDKLKELVRTVSIPVVAIGGIHAGNIQAVRNTGVSAVAMISALTTANNVITATRQMRNLLQT